MLKNIFPLINSNAAYTDEGAQWEKDKYCPSENCYFSQSLRQAQIIILEILNVFLRL